MLRLPRWTTATTTRVAPSTVPVDVRMTIPFWSSVAVPVSSAPDPGQQRVAGIDVVPDA